MFRKGYTTYLSLAFSDKIRCLLIFMNIIFHCFFGIIATIFFIWRYFQTRYSYHLLLSVWIMSTFLIYINQSLLYSTILFVIEILFFISYIVLFIKSGPQRKRHEDFCEQLRKQLHKQEE